MNKKGGLVRIYGLMLAITIIILIVALAPAIKEGVDIARNESSENSIGMNCSTTTSNFVKAGCIATDLNLFWFVGAVILIGGGIVLARIIF